MYTFSLEHKLFLKKIKRERLITTIFQILIIFIFITIWELLAKFNLINTFLFSSPSRVINTIYKLMIDNTLFKHIGITIYEVLLCFGLSSIIGILVASILWRYRIVSKVLDPYITVINSLPKVALGPLFIIWIGASSNSIIFMGLTITIFTMIINVYNYFINTNSDYVIMLKSFKASNLAVFRYVIFPSNLINIITTMKINISLSLIGVIMGELLVSKMGLGYLIMYGSQVFNIDLVISSIFVLAIISYLMYFTIDRIELMIKKRYN